MEFLEFEQATLNFKVKSTIENVMLSSYIYGKSYHEEELNVCIFRITIDPSTFWEQVNFKEVEYNKNSFLNTIINEIYGEKHLENTSRVHANEIFETFEFSNLAFVEASINYLHITNIITAIDVLCLIFCSLLPFIIDFIILKFYVTLFHIFENLLLHQNI